ncbi:DUF6036 family nucleotidyltransferase [Aeromicrobium stalagmiti]|uniref:DUF6036 family nucleotidyltransferase n=1 Tax=Aeromicrobium stalagmiti TaxID=2738988 RepID=UPI00156A0138|nr:DUF6036 family nucleotidyltransferase [Aeromicrobium stalagmiti]NRQ49204.1 hypothetical protein [Aeromicrobium stalagmiti]
MNRTQLAHVLRSASRIANDRDVLVVGSQAILGSRDEDELPAEATASMEADIAFLDDVDRAKADEVEGGIGEFSAFHEQFGYYAEGVHVDTVTLPSGWAERLLRPELPDSEPAQAAFLEPHDLVASKLVAGRMKDLAFAGALVRAGLIDLDVLVERILALPDETQQSVIDRLIGWVESQRTP